MKTCTKCGAEKPLSEFHKHKKGKGGLNAWCKSCINEYGRKRHEENREKMKERNRKYYEENREKVKERRRKYYKENYEKRAEFARKWREENREKISEYNKQYQTNKKAEKMMWAAMDMAGMIE
jgi:chromatin segregation and condensation protein Rec8/ScpA/Scc1 (kleisin family)